MAEKLNYYYGIFGNKTPKGWVDLGNIKKTSDTNGDTRIKIHYICGRRLRLGRKLNIDGNYDFFWYCKKCEVKVNIE